MSALARDDVDLYKTILYHTVQADDVVSAQPGADMMRVLRKELMRSLDKTDVPEYAAVVGDFYKLVVDSLVAAVHRGHPHAVINSNMDDRAVPAPSTPAPPPPHHVVTDEEEYQFHNDDGFFDADDDDDDDDDDDGGERDDHDDDDDAADGNGNSAREEDDDLAGGTSGDAHAAARDAVDPKTRRRDELRRKRRDEEEMLIKEKKVIDEKGRQYVTLGPHPAPRLTVRAPTNTYPSRKALQHRTIVELSSSSSSSSSASSSPPPSPSSVSSGRSSPSSFAVAAAAAAVTGTQVTASSSSSSSATVLPAASRTNSSSSSSCASERHGSDKNNGNNNTDSAAVDADKRVRKHHGSKGADDEDDGGGGDAKAATAAEAAAATRRSAALAAAAVTAEEAKRARRRKCDGCAAATDCADAKARDGDGAGDNNNNNNNNNSGSHDAHNTVAQASDAGEAVSRLTTFLRPLSLNSLKKISESAKAKLRLSSSHDEFVAQIVKTAVRLGCEKAYVLMDKQKIIEDMATHVQTGPLPTTASMDFLNTLPDHLKQSLGGVLGLPHERPPVEDMWERMVAMGLLSVLTNLRLKPLKKIAAELAVALPESNSTEKFCEAIVFAAFPRERIRAKVSRAKLRKVRFVVPPEGMYTKGDMGFITFHVTNISMLTRESERHYSPEFSFAQLKWSLLCMTNKESLALYLCQVGSVHCKFVITVVNQANADDSICNEGTQSFSALSQENDWGFNNVIKFADLLNPAQGFLVAGSDTVVIEVGIVLVEPLKSAARERSATAAATAASATTATAPARERKQHSNAPRVDEAAVRQLLEDERTEQLRKRLRADLTRTVKEEERTRKELAQRATRAYHDLVERLKLDTRRVAKEVADKERKQEQARQRELEKIRQAQQQSVEVRRRLQELRQTSEQQSSEKQKLTKETRELRSVGSKLAEDLKQLHDKIQVAQTKLQQQEKKLELVRRRYDDVVRHVDQTTSASLPHTLAVAGGHDVKETKDDEDDDDAIDADLDRLMDEMTVADV